MMAYFTRFFVQAFIDTWGAVSHAVLEQWCTAALLSHGVLSLCIRDPVKC